MVSIPLLTEADAPLDGWVTMVIELISSTPGATIKGTKSKIISPATIVVSGTGFIVGGIVLQPIVKIVAVTEVRELSHVPLFIPT